MAMNAGNLKTAMKAAIIANLRAAYKAYWFNIPDDERLVGYDWETFHAIYWEAVCKGIADTTVDHITNNAKAVDIDGGITWYLDII